MKSVVAEKKAIRDLLIKKPKILIINFLSTKKGEKSKICRSQIAANCLWQGQKCRYLCTIKQRKSKKTMEKMRKKEEVDTTKNGRSELVCVTFGMPSAKCARYGICKIDTYLAIPPQYVAENNTCFAELTTDSNAILIFFRSTMTRHTEGKFFSSDYFFIEESKPTKWGILLRGSYPIEMGDNFYTVIIDLDKTVTEVKSTTQKQHCASTIKY